MSDLDGLSRDAPHDPQARFVPHYLGRGQIPGVGVRV